MDWLNFALALAAFFASHAVPAIPAVKAGLKQRLGRAGYGAVFGTISLAVLVWVVIAAGQAPYVEVWPQYPWMRWAANLVMPVALLILVLAAGRPNPLSFGGRRTGFDPARPGIAGFARHPLLWALFLWSGAHLLVNGDLAHVILFGAFAIFCLMGMGLLDRRRRREMGEAEWYRLALGTANLPQPLRLAAAVTLPRLLIFAVIWAAVLAAHPHVIGVSPLP
ncbi:MAG: NnrU family protein [Rhodobacteraceae bacterium GWE1_64_9]|uniref:NnrU family protein n=1 Tax=Gemmobacter serpentinus TaxID=2652247 RepID=UPI0008B6FFC6|nr:NnrU family protein [Gemmobacter serpentinus]OHC45479.1 MAG: NnrU family protein [Rhodobacteraceae bacterium GWE1_64_9]OHC49254.1 MAG: NnrU family protein [Rhodobacteraceae bacterium GWF1_65_7]HBD90636.1 NnrU family protein [Gemmobacter sp.]